MELIDLISKKKVDLNDVIYKTSSEKCERINFHFTPEGLNDKIQVDTLKEEDTTLMIKGIDPDMELDFCFSEMSHA